MKGLRVPPGRSGRQWLRDRLDAAQRGADVLERKLRALTARQADLAERAGVTGAAWEARAREARTWLLREALAGGQREMRLAEPAATARVDVTWTTVIGVRLPEDAAVTTPSDLDPISLPGSVAVVRTAQAFRRALDAGARHAAAAAAERILDHEIMVTRQRIRSLRHRWIPRLLAAQALVEFELEERERDEGIRHRWAARDETSPPSVAWRHHTGKASTENMRGGGGYHE
ncbi:V-type ATP synthase subunit D [Allokutzneria oryzae]|uniref:V-type ATP synthase subunit D n=1 Tax=Allokutzneria oryzae TaxID=1378989 RepID=A0ABV6A3U4_9PSEU